MRYMLFPYRSASEGARDLSEGLGGQRIRREGSTYTRREGDLIINWGASDCPFPDALNANNRVAINKLAFFERMAHQGITPLFVTDRDNTHLLTFPVFCRTRVEGADGEGVVIAETPADLVDARLYVECIDKTAEYRVHVGRYINCPYYLIGHQQKFRRPDETRDPRVWTGNSTNLVWTVNGSPVVLPSAVTRVIKDAWALLPELTFGAFDVIYDRRTDKAYVVEVNSAPLMTPKTVDCYVKFFNDYVEARNASVVVTPEPVAVNEPTEHDVTDVFNQLSREEVSLRTVIKGYLRSLR